MISVAIADDQPLVRSGLRMILQSEPDLMIAGEAGNGADAVTLVERIQPDVMLLDVEMPGVDGLEAMTQLARTATTTRIVMLTTFDLDEYVYRAMRAGAAGFLLKDMPGEDIVAAVRQAARGADALLAPALTRRLIDRYTSERPRASAPALDRLTARELDVLRLVARGLSNAEIAAELFIGETTVKTHVARILMKLGLRDRVQAVVLAYESGLVHRAPGGGSGGGTRSQRLDDPGASVIGSEMGVWPLRGLQPPRRRSEERASTPHPRPSGGGGIRY